MRRPAPVPTYSRPQATFLCRGERLAGGAGRIETQGPLCPPKLRRRTALSLGLENPKITYRGSEPFRTNRLSLAVSNKTIGVGTDLNPQNLRRTNKTPPLPPNN